MNLFSRNSSKTPSSSITMAGLSTAKELPDRSKRNEDVEAEEEEYHDTEPPILENPFESESSRILFDAIDKLQSCQAGQDIDIPQVSEKHEDTLLVPNFSLTMKQLVIVGAQSAGKSSLLQSLIDVPFPVGSGCCTRFATRIVSRRTPAGSKNTTLITIVKPDFDLNEQFNYDGNREVPSFSHTPSTFTAQDFTELMTEVSPVHLPVLGSY